MLICYLNCPWSKITGWIHAFRKANYFVSSLIKEVSIMARIKFSREFFQEWQNNPKTTAEKYGLKWSDLDLSWQRTNWSTIQYKDFEEMWRKSRWANLVDWSA